MARALVIKGANFEENRVAQVEFAGIPCTAVAFGSDTYNVTSMSIATQITVTKTPADTTDVPVFTVADTSVARIENGGLYAVGFGTTTITVTCGNATDTATIVVSSIEMALLKLPGRFTDVSSWGDDNPIKYTANAQVDGFATEKITSATTPDGITGNPNIAVIMIPDNTYKVRVESPTLANWQITIRYTTIDSTLQYGGTYYAKFISTAIKATAGKYVEFTDMPSGADSFAFDKPHSDGDYAMNVIFTPAA